MGNRRGKKLAPTGKLSRGSKTLSKILEEAGPMATAIRRKFNRTALWRWCVGARRPELETMIELRKITNDRVTIEMWTQGLQG